MKQIMVYILSIAAALMVPLEGTDVGKLQPVAVVQLYREGENVIVVTDTGDSGTGETVKTAFENLEETTAGMIFLDTADFLLLSSNAIDSVGALENYLKPSIRICLAEGKIDPVQAGEYLTVHRPGAQLKNYKGQEMLEKLVQENSRLKLK